MKINRSLNSLPNLLSVVIVLGLLVLATVGVKARVWRSFASHTGNQQRLLSTTRGPVQVVRFTLYDIGIYPQEARVAHGRVVLSLVDYTGGSAGLVVERETEQVRELAGLVTRTGGHWRGRRELNLGPGIYRLYDASRPENRATLVVEP